MSVLLKKIKAENDIYILITDAVELIAKTLNCPTDDVTQYLAYHQIFKVLPIFCMDDNFRIYPVDSSKKLEGNEALFSYFKKSDLAAFKPLKEYELFKDEIIPTTYKGTNAPKPPSHIKTTASFKHNKKMTVGELLKAKQQENGMLPNEWQSMTMLYDYFTPHQASCLMAGLHPEFDGRNDELEIAKGVIEGGIKSGKLILDDDKQIEANDLKSYLYSKKWIMKGFNSDLLNDVSKPEQSSQLLAHTQAKVIRPPTDNDSPKASDDYVIHEVDGAVFLDPAKPSTNNTPRKNLGEHQKLLIDYEAFTPDEIICLIVDYNPQFINRDYKFLSYWSMVIDAVESDELVAFNENMQIPAQQVKVWLASNNYIYEGFNDNLPIDPIAQVMQLKAQLSAAHATIEHMTNENAKAQADINKLKAQADTPADSHKPLNLQLTNIKKAAVKHFNKSLATALIELDYRSYLSKNDIVNFIRPHMNALTLLLSDNDADKAKTLVVADKTISTTHLQGLTFKTGRPSKKDGEKENIELLFTRKLFNAD